MRVGLGLEGFPGVQPALVTEIFSMFWMFLISIHVHRLSMNKSIGLNPELWQTLLRLEENIALSYGFISKVQVNIFHILGMFTDLNIQNEFRKN